jgi:hypothetical protein
LEDGVSYRNLPYSYNFRQNREYNLIQFKDENLMVSSTSFALLFAGQEQLKNWPDIYWFDVLDGGANF